MSIDDPQRARRHARLRWVKRLLRFTPRRAVFHRYPVVGRFAGFARRRAHLWSFKPAQVRPAIYIGTVLSLWPVLGIQLLLAVAVSLLSRTNVMVTGGLQFITNPLTAAPLYYFTYRVGQFVLTKTGWAEARVPVVAAGADTVTLTLSANEALPRSFDWTSTFGTTVMALFIGGTLCGLVLGAVIDLLYLLFWKIEHKQR